MKCPNCSKKRGLGQYGFHWGNVPKTGRAAKNGLCVKCDREVNGSLTLPDWMSVGKWCRAFVRAMKESRSAGADK